jgi:hypothetical protein
MTPVRVIVVALALVLGALLAVGAWGEPPTQRLSDDDYIAIALSDPQVFHPTGGTSGQKVVAERVERTPSSVIVTVTSDGIRFNVYIDPRTNRVTEVKRL